MRLKARKWRIFAAPLTDVEDIAAISGKLSSSR